MSCATSLKQLVESYPSVSVLTNKITTLHRLANSQQVCGSVGTQHSGNTSHGRNEFMHS